MSNELILPPAKNKKAEVLVANISRILPALHAGVDPQMFASSCVTEINALKIKKEFDVTSNSVLMACFNAAKIGLIPGAIFGHAFFIPRKSLLNLEIGYKGYLELAYRNDFLRDVYSEVILKDENFESWTDSNGPQVLHRPIPIHRDLTKNNVVGAYCVWHSRKGGRGIEVVTRKQLDDVDSGKNVWLSNPIEMYKKTPLRRAHKYWRLSATLAMASLIEEQAERGEDQVIDSTSIPGDTKEATQSLSDIPDNESPTD